MLIPSSLLARELVLAYRLGYCRGVIELESLLARDTAKDVKNLHDVRQNALTEECMLMLDLLLARGRALV